MVRKSVVVTNAAGFHVRPAGVVVKAAESCSSKIEILYKNNFINAKSLLNILSVSIRQGAEIVVTCEGPEEEKDLEKMIETIENLGKKV